MSEEWTSTTWFETLRADFLKVTTGLKGPTKIQKTTPPEDIWPEAWTRLSKKQKEKLQIGMMLMPSCKQFAATGGIHEVSGDDNHCLKVNADARLKMEKPTVPVMSCTLGSQCWRER